MSMRYSFPAYILYAGKFYRFINLNYFPFLHQQRTRQQNLPCIPHAIRTFLLQELLSIPARNHNSEDINRILSHREHSCAKRFFVCRCTVHIRLQLGLSENESVRSVYSAAYREERNQTAGYPRDFRFPQRHQGA